MMTRWHDRVNANCRWCDMWNGIQRKKKKEEEQREKVPTCRHRMKIGKFNEIELKCDDHEIVRAMNASSTWHTVLYDFGGGLWSNEHSCFQEIAKRVRVFSFLLSYCRLIANLEAFWLGVRLYRQSNRKTLTSQTWCQREAEHENGTHSQRTKQTEKFVFFFHRVFTQRPATWSGCV